MLFWTSLAFSIFSSVQLLSRVWLFVTPWTAACQASLSITISPSSLKLMSMESVMPSSHLILCRPLLLLPPIPPSIRVSSDESTLHMRWPKYWSFSFSIIPSKEHPGLISFRMDWLLSHIKNEIMQFAATWIALQIVIVNEVRESQTVYDITCMWNLRKWYKVTYKPEADSQILRTNLWLPKGKDWDKG